MLQSFFRARRPKSRKIKRLRCEQLETRMMLAAVPQYAVAEIGSLDSGLPSVVPSSINNRGQVVGQALACGEDHAFLYDGSLHDLLASSARFSHVAGINDSGLIVGWVNSSGGKQHVCTYYAGAMHDLFTGVANAVNNHGQIVGRSSGRAFLYNDGITYLTDPSGITRRYSTATSINDLGQIVGNVEVLNGEGYSIGSTTPHAVIWANGDAQLLPDNGRGSEAFRINDMGQVIGVVYSQRGFVVGDPEPGYNFLYTGGQMVHLALKPHDINDNGQVVGYGTNARAAFYSGGVEYDLNNLLVSDTGVTLLDATAINNRGQIVGYGFNAKGEQAAFLLTPVAEGTTAVLTSAIIPSIRGYDAVFTATVDGVVSGTYPTGKVQFLLDGTTVLATTNLVNGVARYTTTPDAIGTHTVAARYVGNAEFAMSMSRAVALRLPASRLIVAQPKSVTAGVTSRFIIKVADARGKVVASFNGSVTLTVASGPTTLTRTVKAVRGVATFNLQLSAGRYVLRAVAKGLPQVLVTVTAARRPFWTRLIEPFMSPFLPANR